MKKKCFNCRKRKKDIIEQYYVKQLDPFLKTAKKGFLCMGCKKEIESNGRKFFSKIEAEYEAFITSTGLGLRSIISFEDFKKDYDKP